MKSEEDFSRGMATRLDEHKAVWRSRMSKPEFIRQAKNITQSLLDSSKHEFDFVSFTCPACAQEAVARVEADYDYDHEAGSSYVTGFFVNSIRCYFCGLRLQDYEELNYVNADSILKGGLDVA
jgi:hypothetical protein